MPLKWGISSLTFNDGRTVQLAEGAIAFVVGPNNSGKSAMLREIRERLTGGGRPIVLSDLRTFKDGTPEDLLQWLSPHRVASNMGNNAGQFAKLGGAPRGDGELIAWWQGHGNGALAACMVHYAAADSRLNTANGAPLHDRRVNPPMHPLQVLYEDMSAEGRVSHAFEAAFRQAIFVDRTAGSSVSLRVGKKPTTRTADEVFSRENLDATTAIPTLDTQGDGMRSFVGALLHAFIADWFVVLIDEPEAFLHPPQANCLGKLLAENNSQGQRIIATHSSDILRGALNAAQAAITIIRLERVGDKNQARILEPSDITAGVGSSSVAQTTPRSRRTRSRARAGAGQRPQSTARGAGGGSGGARRF